MILRLALVLLITPSTFAASLVSSVAASLKSRGDAPVITMSVCGAGRASPAVVCEALGLSSGSGCTLVDAPTPLALLDSSDEGADGATAAAAADVLALEVRFADLVERTAHGLGQLQPLLQRSVRLRDLRPQPKLLLLTVTDYDASAVSEAEVQAFAQAQIEELVSALSLPAEEPALTAADLLQLHCFFLPSKTASPDGYESALSKLGDALTNDASSSYLLSDSKWMQQASKVVATVGQAAERAPAAPPSASPAEGQAAYQCGLLAEAAARGFQKGASALRKAADGTLVRACLTLSSLAPFKLSIVAISRSPSPFLLVFAQLPDFGDQASALVNDAVARFDADAATFKGVAPVGAARSALAEQLQRALYGPFRKQLAVLQRMTLSKFRAKVSATKPSADIEAQLKILLDEAKAAFDTSAKSLLPPGVRWTYSYERQSVLESMADTAKSHVETLQVQGLYLSTKNNNLPIDFAAHWLLPHPFGRDSRYDPSRRTTCRRTSRRRRR